MIRVALVHQAYASRVNCIGDHRSFKDSRVTLVASGIRAIFVVHVIELAHVDIKVALVIRHHLHHIILEILLRLRIHYNLELNYKQNSKFIFFYSNFSC